MSAAELHYEDKVVIQRAGLDRMFELLRRDGYRVFGPALRDGAIAYDELNSVADLPAGWTDEQAAGSYRVRRREDEALFGYVVGPHSWKRLLHPPAVRLWTARRDDAGFAIEAEASLPPKYAFIGVRPCDLRAIWIHDKVFLSNMIADPSYRALRSETFIVAVQCGESGRNCFCVSVGAGPRAASGFDLALTEVVEQDRHLFVVEVGSTRGADLLAEVPYASAQPENVEEAERRSREAAAAMGRVLDTRNLKELLYRNAEHRRWDDVATRCLSCANCTMVCPTCFCTTIEDVTDLSGEVAERWRKWDSCFTEDFSYIHGGSVRFSERARYRHWLTHKLASWIDQFGMLGCVGCGRCITWCPAAIDITEEVRALRESQPVARSAVS